MSDQFKGSQAFNNQKQTNKKYELKARQFLFVCLFVYPGGETGISVKLTGDSTFAVDSQWVIVVCDWASDSKTVWEKHKANC